MIFFSYFGTDSRPDIFPQLFSREQMNYLIKQATTSFYAPIFSIRALHKTFPPLKYHSIPARISRTHDSGYFSVIIFFRADFKHKQKKISSYTAPYRTFLCRHIYIMTFRNRKKLRRASCTAVQTSSRVSFVLIFWT